ncbi:MAG: hypothetical protein BWY95_02278 [Bacteroidetes bacterium ADurb.BinA104]|nr:MAG: hypothetical protein BWY95_02278 [Bacteroidetes bacterium ADurb.BinA104]
MIYSCQMFSCIQKQGGTRTKQSRSLGGYYGTVLQLYGGRRNACLLLTLLGCYRSAARCSGYARLAHEQYYLVDFGLISLAVEKIAQRSIVSADHLILGGTAANLVIAYAESRHIHTHVGR